MYTLKVVDIRKETEDTVTLCFKQPLLKKISYKAGQYLTLVFRINGRRYLRPYSFSSAPSIDSLLEITVKRVVGGIVSNHINDEVKVGDTIEVLPPMGDFIFDPDKRNTTNNVFLWGAGSGITPLISIAKFVLANYPEQKVTLAYGNRCYESTLFIETIQELERVYATTLKVLHFHTNVRVDEQENPYVIQGRIDAEKVFEIMKNESDAKQSIHYICGPAGLKESVKQALRTLGISETQINSEDFELVKDPKEFRDIVTQHVEISINKESTKVEVTKGKSILEAGLDALIELSYSCQTGNCLICKGKVVNGRVKTIGIEKQPKGLENDEVLLCCSYPLSEDVRILV